jgi:hypothetical protein
MKLLLASSAIAIAFAAIPAHAQQSPPSEGSVRVEGVSPAQVLGAIDTQKLTDKAAADVNQSATTTVVAEPPKVDTQVTVDTKVEQRADAVVETRTETITPVSGRPELNPENPIAPEVQAVVEKKRRYTTADIVAAQLEAVRNTPTTEPTTTITTTTTTPG